MPVWIQGNPWEPQHVREQLCMPFPRSFPQHGVLHRGICCKDGLDHVVSQLWGCMWISEREHWEAWLSPRSLRGKAGSKRFNRTQRYTGIQQAKPLLAHRNKFQKNVTCSEKQPKSQLENLLLPSKPHSLPRKRFQLHGGRATLHLHSSVLCWKINVQVLLLRNCHAGVKPPK